MTMGEKVNWTFRERGVEAIRRRQHRIGLSSRVHQAGRHRQEGPIGLVWGLDFVGRAVGD